MSSQPDDTPDLINDAGSNEDDDLFGDDDADIVPTEEPAERHLDDEQLDSSDDLGRDDRVATTVEGHDDEDVEEGRPLRIAACEVPRINYPEGDESYLIKMPDFLGIKQEEFTPNTYELPSVSHDGDTDRKTSAMSTAMSSMFWRHDPKNPTNTQSTARFVRWSDGSLTIQLATKPGAQYPANVIGLRKDFPKPLPKGTPYRTDQDSYTFLAAAHSTEVIDLQLVRALDATMKIHPSRESAEEADQRLRDELMAQSNADNPMIRMKDIKEDPELARKAAEQFEKERMRAQRRRENAEERATTRRDNTLRRGGIGRSGGAGLSIEGLEDDGMPVSRGKKQFKRKTNRRGEIYSDDEDDTVPRRTREDEYDREDDFVANSEEEPEQYDDDDGLPSDEEEYARDREPATESRQRRGGTPKRSRMDEIDDDEDAEGEPDDEVLQQGSPQRPRKVRKVVLDEDDD